LNRADYRLCPFDSSAADSILKIQDMPYLFLIFGPIFLIEGCPFGSMAVFQLPAPPQPADLSAEGYHDIHGQSQSIQKQTRFLENTGAEERLRKIFQETGLCYSAT
jgi:hypothetical protein